MMGLRPLRLVKGRGCWGLEMEADGILSIIEKHLVILESGEVYKQVEERGRSDGGVSWRLL